jgi:hypothetical protein
MSLVTFECDDCTRLYVSYQHEDCPWCALRKAEALLREVLEKEEPWNAVPAFEWLAKAKGVCGG